MGRIQRYRKSLANGLLFHKILQLFTSAGIVIEPYYFYQELLPPEVTPVTDRRFEDFEFFEAGIGDADGIADLNPNADLRKEIQEDFTRGRRCFALRRGHEIVAASWCNTREIHFPPCRRPLGDNEAYLYRMETPPQYRGHDLAPYLRTKCHEFLNSSGRELLYSYTDYFNRPAVRFKEKIGARILFVGLYVELFGMVKKNWILSRKQDLTGSAKPAPEPSCP